MPLITRTDSCFDPGPDPDSVELMQDRPSLSESMFPDANVASHCVSVAECGTGANAASVSWLTIRPSLQRVRKGSAGLL